MGTNELISISTNDITPADIIENLLTVKYFVIKLIYDLEIKLNPHFETKFI